MGCLRVVHHKTRGLNLRRGSSSNNFTARESARVPADGTRKAPRTLCDGPCRRYFFWRSLRLVGWFAAGGGSVARGRRRGLMRGSKQIPRPRDQCLPLTAEITTLAFKVPSGRSLTVIKPANSSVA